MKDNQVDSMITSDKVFFFDMDGTLINTDLANFLAYRKAIRSIIETDKDLVYKPEERFNRSVLKTTYPNLSDAEIDRIILAKEDCYEEFLHETTLVTEIADILFKYSKTNQTFLVTNCRMDRAFATLNYHKITDKFTKILYRNFGDDGNAKNKFQSAIAKLGIAPNVIIAFENEETEIAHAKIAGIKIINPKIS